MGIWLRLFQILTVLGIIGLPVMIVYVAYTVWGTEIDKETWIDFLAIFIESLPIFILSILIFRELNIIRPSTPEAIEELLVTQFGITFVVSLVLYVLFKQSYITVKPSSVFFDIVYCIVWVSFFRRSKRVKSYYEINKT